MNSEQLEEQQTNKKQSERQRIDADLLEATPTAGGLWHWILASPMLIFLAWTWIELVDRVGVTAWSWVNILIGSITFIVLIVLPLGYLAHRIVTSFPRLFKASGWDVQPRVKVSEMELYMAKVTYHDRERAHTNWERMWLRAAQGWVYLEIAAIFGGAIVMFPLFFSAMQFSRGG